ncbi:MAG: protoporphyrinogen oxidase [Alphaproteobacteria bacterium]
MTVDVTIIGGGVSGLATAWELKAAGYSVALLERQARPGGNAVSERIGGFLMEHGPSTVDARAEAALDYSRTLGLEGERCRLGAGVRNRYLVGGGVLKGIPAHPLGFLRSDYLSLAGRLRMLIEPAIPRGKAGVEESIADFCARRFGAEFSSRVMEPLVRGIYGGDAATLSIGAVFPALLAFEQRHGSIARGVMQSRWAGRKMPGRRLYSWRDGVGSLPRALAARLGNSIHTGVAVRRITRMGSLFRIDTGRDGMLSARAVVLATQPHVAAQLLDRLDDMAADAAGGIDAPPVAVVYLGYRREQVDHPLDGLGFFAARGEGRGLNGAQFCSTMFDGRAPQGHVAIAGYFGGDGAPDLGRGPAPAPELMALAREEFADLLGAHGEPVVARVRHWPRGLPQYRLGHAARVQVLNHLPDRVPGLFLTGNYFDSPSIGACLARARDVAARVQLETASSVSCPARRSIPAFS